MDNKNLELFKQAINEGLSRRFDKISSSFTDEIVCSGGHELAMRSIVYGKASEKRALSPKTRRIIAILVAAALLLTGCGMLFRNQIREAIREFYVAITLSDKVGGESAIEEIYELSYVPDGFNLKTQVIESINTLFIYENEANQIIWFEQRISEGSTFIIDTESGYSKMMNISEHDIYFRETNHYTYYIWTSDKYAFYIKTNMESAHIEIVSIINGLAIK